MDAAKIMLAAIGVLATCGIVVGGFLLDRRGHRTESAAWMRNWAIRNRALTDLYRRWKGPLRLQDQSAKPVGSPRNRKVALRRNRSTKG